MKRQYALGLILFLGAVYACRSTPSNQSSIRDENVTIFQKDANLYLNPDVRAVTGTTDAEREEVEAFLNEMVSDYRFWCTTISAAVSSCRTASSESQNKNLYITHAEGAAPEVVPKNLRLISNLSWAKRNDTLPHDHVKNLEVMASFVSPTREESFAGGRSIRL